MKKLLILLAFMVVTITANAAVVQSGSCGTNVTYVLNDDGTLVISGSGNMSNYTSDSNTPWYNKIREIRRIQIKEGVTSIGDNTFPGCYVLTSVEIPNSVTSIGKYAFCFCNGLTSISIPSSVTSIGERAFAYCGLTSIEIPAYVSSIGQSAFESNEYLKSIVVDKFNTKYDSRDNCNAIIETTSNNLIQGSGETIIPNGIVRIKSLAFYGIGELESIIIPNSVTNIEDYAFGCCWNLSSVTLGGSVKNIGKGAFQVCQLLKDFFCFSEEVPSAVENKYYDGAMGTGTFFDAFIENATLHVPASALEAYKSTAPWSDFGTIVAIQDITVTPRPTSGNYMYVEKQTVKPGQVVQIPVELVVDEQYEEEIVGFQCNIKLPEGFDFIKNAKGNAVITLNQNRIDGHSVTSMLKADGTLNIGCASMSLGAFTDLDGAIMYVSVMAKEGMADGEYAMQISNVRLSTEDEEIQCPTITQALEVKNFTLGDLNDDGDWTILDVTLTIKHMLEETYTEAGDMNGDGAITILDVTKVIQYMLNEGPVEAASAPAARKMAKVAAKDSQKLYAENLYIEPGAQQTLTVNAHLNTEDYVGCQLEMQLPEGFSYVTNKKGAVVVTPNSYRCETHSASVKIVDSRTLRIGIASMSLDPIYFGEDGDESLFTVKVQADASVEAGNHEISITKVRFSTEEVEDQFAATEGYFRAFGEEAISLVVPEGGYATLCLPYNATVPTGLKAYKATGVKNGMVVVEEQTSIAACTPLIIEGTAGTYNFSGDNSDADEFEYSVGSLKSSLVPAESNSGYVLQNLSDGLGFYKIADALTVPAFRTVLDGASVSAAPAFVPVGFDEDANAIEATGYKLQTTDSVYTLDGKRVKTMEKGKIYIVSGVKMIVK
ncbi:MAG: leucine-rich repeat protein [Bacteroidaceae bacterium]|nr:leucine-rich repeat protein [Bacteroidaceae bacterium]